ncbi:MAG: hypothetical protein RLZZ338_4477 [Cyanobacteriota bacterium]|jgi:hypothetical protein
MNILTNRLKINFDIDAIKRDFVFIRLERQRKDQKDKWYGRRELDYLFGKDFNAISVMFQYGNFAFAMFKKTVDVYQLLSRIRENEAFQNNAVIEVTPVARLDGNKDCICEAWLAQILLNSLSASQSRFPQYQYCNLTGSLLLVRDFEGKKKDYLDVAKITITSAYLLTVQIVRHRTKISVLSELKKTKNTDRIKELNNALAKPYYKFEASTGSLRIHLRSDGEIDPKSTYIECGVKGKKASKLFLEFGSSDDFYKSRAGTLHHVMTRINKELSQYMTVDFCSREIDEDDTVKLNNTLMDKPEIIRELLKGQLIHIVDRVHRDDSTDLITKLREFLTKYIPDEKMITSGKREKKGAFNFRIIHDKSYYKNNEEADEYVPSNDNIQRQNITIESNENVSLALVKTTIKELLIKRDISSGKFTLFDWSTLKPKGVWTFAAWDEEASHVVFMEIEPNGNLKFHKIENMDLFNCGKFAQYKDLMTDSSSNKKIRTLEGLVISETGDINQIFLTDEITIPNLSEIDKIINEVETELPENKRTGHQLADLVKEFLQEQSGLDQEKFNYFSEYLVKKGSEPISKADFYALIGQYLGTKKRGKDKTSYVSSTKEATDFRDYLLKQHEIRLKFPQDHQSKEDLFDASLNIKYFGETEKEAYYFVGYRRDQFQFSFKDACHLRQIVAVNGSKLIFRELLPTMDVDFVRTGQSTVIPFPFKYIREYKNFGAAE